MSEPLYQILVFGDRPDDKQVIADWWAEHGHGDMPVELLPPSGFLVSRDGERVAGAFLYLAVGIGVAFLEWAVAKPGLPLAEAIKAFDVLVDFMKQHTAAIGYSVLWANTLPGIGRVLRRRHGFHPVGSRVAMVYGKEAQHGH